MSIRTVPVGERRPTIRGTLARRWRTFREFPVIPVVIITTLAVFAVFAPLIAPHDPLQARSLDDRTTPPSWLDSSSTFFLGTDHLGRDVLSRIVYGARISLLVSSSVLVAGVLVGTSLGLLAGYFGGQVDELIMRIVDIKLSLPFILVALVVAIVFKPSLTVVVVLLILFFWSSFARQVRAETLHIKTLDYVMAARVAGASAVRIMWKHILPGVISTVIVIATLTIGTVILVESVLSYLGVGVPAPTPAWGAMVADGSQYLQTAWWIAFFPGAAIFFTVLAFNFLGDWLRDRLDPRLRQLG